MHRKAICLAWPFENVTNADHLDFRNSSTGKGSGSSSSLSLSFMRRSIRNLHNCSRASAEKEKKEDSQLHAEELGRGTGEDLPSPTPLPQLQAKQLGELGQTCQAPPKAQALGRWKFLPLACPQALRLIYDSSAHGEQEQVKKRCDVVRGSPFFLSPASFYNSPQFSHRDCIFSNNYKKKNEVESLWAGHSAQRQLISDLPPQPQYSDASVY